MQIRESLRRRRVFNIIEQMLESLNTIKGMIDDRQTVWGGSDRDGQRQT